MKIGIITFHGAYNYGAVLQCYALQKKVKKINEKNDVEIINYVNENVMSGYRFFPKNTKNIKTYIKGIVKYILYGRKIRKRFFNFNNFMKSKYVLSREKYDDTNLNNIVKEYEVLITGSDQVWNPTIVGCLSDAYSLNFGEYEIKRISYAASIGDSSQVNKNKNIFRDKLKKLNSISVREEDAKKELEKIIQDKNINVVLDPTLLLNREEWNEEIKECSECKEKYILAYVVEPDQEYKKIVNYLSEKTRLKVIHFEKRNKYNNVLRSAYTDGPLDFINLIKNAEYVVATSFHATVFSIIFNKKFFIVPHKKTGSRVTNILDKLQIQDRIYYSLDEFKNINYDFNTNWEKVNKRLEEERKKSIDWLKNAIEG